MEIGPTEVDIYTNLKVTGQANGGFTASVGATGATATINWNNGNVQQATLATGPQPFLFTNGVTGGTYILKVVQGTAGVISWPLGVKWPGGVNPTQSGTAGYVDVFSFVFDGTLYYGNSQTGYTS
jgi:hypothetical protein